MPVLDALPALPGKLEMSWAFGGENADLQAMRAGVEAVGRYLLKQVSLGIATPLPRTSPKPPSIQKQFEQLSMIRPGWFDGEGAAIERATLRILEQLFIELVEAELPTPFLYPTVEGGVRAEWSFPEWEVSASTHPSRSEIHLHATHLPDEAFKERDLNLSSAHAKDELASFVREFAEARLGR